MFVHIPICISWTIRPRHEKSQQFPLFCIHFHFCQESLWKKARKYKKVKLSFTANTYILIRCSYSLHSRFLHRMLPDQRVFTPHYRENFEKSRGQNAFRIGRRNVQSSLLLWWHLSINQHRPAPWQRTMEMWTEWRSRSGKFDRSTWPQIFCHQGKLLKYLNRKMHLGDKRKV